MNWHQQASKYLLKGDYQQATEIYEQATQTEPEVISHYWHLGLAYLLQGQEEAAQATWLFVMAQGSLEEAEQWTEELVQILHAEAQRQADITNLQNSWLIRQHLREIAPAEISNLLHLIQLSIDLEDFTPQVLEEWQVVELLQQSSPTLIDPALVLQVLAKVLEFPAQRTLAFAEACLPHTQTLENWLDALISASVKAAYQRKVANFAVELIELCLKLDPDHFEALGYLPRFYLEAKRYPEAIEAAKRFYSHCHTLELKFVGSCLLLRTLLTAGSWVEAMPVAKNFKALLLKIIQVQPINLELSTIQFLIINTGYLLYLRDDLRENRWLQNQAAQLFQKNLQTNTPAAPELSFNREWEPSRPLRVGYIAHTLRNHSVGWLSRWFFQHHDRESFQTHIYLVNQSLENAFFQTWFGEKVDFVHSCDNDIPATAEKIREDQIDILVDLDSTTLDFTATVMALKPAPVQVTWLGWDASGLPTIDYFIADPYVLPDNAQEHYQEKIWRLPQTYIAVDGFEVDVPTLRRDQLEIPADAIIYLSAQTGFKRHPDTIRLQMQIIKEVPDSYFLIKGLSDEATVQRFFTQLAEEAGIAPERLRFLPIVSNEYVHRANLQIADIVLDTYPYNGATTTLETLWMGIPLVTRVGEQFAARNSYAFLMNVGVTEGIAWTDEEYVEWGVRLGKDVSLRQQVAWKLRASRQTSPLWNAKQFTHEMENAYKQMWEKHLEMKD